MRAVERSTASARLGCGSSASATCGREAPLVAVNLGLWTTVIWRTDRTILRRMAPLLALCAATILAIVLTEVSSALGASRNVQMTLLALVVVLAAAFLVWGSVSTSRQLWAAYRFGRTQAAKPQS